MHMRDIIALIKSISVHDGGGLQIGYIHGIIERLVYSDGFARVRTGTFLGAQCEWACSANMEIYSAHQLCSYMAFLPTSFILI